MTVDFCPGTRWVQLKGRAVAVTPDDRVYLVANGHAVELIPAPAEPPMRFGPNEVTGDGS